MENRFEKFTFFINFSGFLILSVLTLFSMNKYGQYQVTTEITNVTFSATILLAPIVFLSLPPLIGNPFALFKFKDRESRVRLCRIAIALSLICSLLILLAIALMISTFNPGIYNPSGREMPLVKLFAFPGVLALILFAISGYQFLQTIRMNGSEKGTYFRGIQMDRGHFRYLVINEIGFLILWVFFLVLMLSRYGEYIVFHGTTPYTLETAGTIFFDIPNNLWILADVPLIGAPLLTFALRKKEETESAYRFTSYISFGVCLGMLAYMVFTLVYYDHTFYQYTNSYQAVTSASGNPVSFVPFLIFPIILVVALLILAGLQLHEIHQWQKTIPKEKPRI